MRAIICGGRGFDDVGYLRRCLAEINAIEPITCVICGMATGADTLGRLWARQMAIPVDAFVPDWVAYGKAAGAIRNRQMLMEGRADIVIAFPGNKGTANMLAQATKAGVFCIVLDGQTSAGIDNFRRAQGKS